MNITSRKKVDSIVLKFIEYIGIAGASIVTMGVILFFFLNSTFATNEQLSTLERDQSVININYMRQLGDIDKNQAISEERLKMLDQKVDFLKEGNDEIKLMLMQVIRKL